MHCSGSNPGLYACSHVFSIALPVLSPNICVLTSLPVVWGTSNGTLAKLLVI